MPKNNMKTVAVLGSTGSIGRSALDVIKSVPGLKIKVHSLACGDNVKLLAEQVKRFRPKRVAIGNTRLVDQFRKFAPRQLDISSGEDALVDLARDPEADVVLMAIVGAAALKPTLAALKAGKTVALANKESLVMAGRIVTSTAKKYGGRIIPVDSEHSGAFQLMASAHTSEIKRLIITSSGGSLRNIPVEKLHAVTPEQALNHPTWDMGVKVTIDSATSMNKALELIEAHYLFGLPAEALAVWVHPQSIIHAVIEYRDGTTMLHASQPDMRLPIQYAFGFLGPGRLPGPVKQIPVNALANITFSEPDPKRMPAIELGLRVCREEGTLGAVLNAANEVAVSAFMNRKIPFTRIVPICREVMESHKNIRNPSLDDIFQADFRARSAALKLI